MIVTFGNEAEVLTSSLPDILVAWCKLEEQTHINWVLLHWQLVEMSFHLSELLFKSTFCSCHACDFSLIELWALTEHEVTTELILHLVKN